MRSSLLNIATLLLALICWSGRDAPAHQRMGDSIPRKFDEYMSPGKEWPRFLRFVKQLKREPKKHAYVIVYAGRKIIGSGVYYDGEDWRRWASYNLKAQGLKEEQFVIVNGGLREQDMIELWIVTPGGPLPRPTPTATETVVCPSVSVMGDAYVLRREQQLRFETHLSAWGVYSFPGVTFNWTVSTGRIVSGQGTDTIAVDASQSPDSRIEATVEVVGLSRECESRGSRRTDVGIIPYKFDEFGKINFEDLEARLDNLATYLQRDITLRTHIITYGGRHGLRGEATAWGTLMRDYLLNTRGLDSTRVVTVDGGYREERSGELWLLPRDAAAPKASPTVNPKYAHPERSRKRRHTN